MKQMSPIIFILIGSVFIAIGVFQLLRSPQAKTISVNPTPDIEKPQTAPRGQDHPTIDHLAKLEEAIEIAVADGTLSKKEEDILREKARLAGRNGDELINQLREELKAVDNAETTLVDENQKAGYDFEKYVVQKFDKKYFEITQWAGDKFVEGRFAKTNQQPDMQLELRKAGNRYPLAVECKWRSNPNGEFVRFADDEQLLRYQQFAESNKIPTFIILGIGGKPSKPAEVFVIPIDRFKKPLQHLNNLKPFKKENLSKGFYFDEEKGTLS
jgi:hypothetical protein